MGRSGSNRAAAAALLLLLLLPAIFWKTYAQDSDTVVNLKSFTLLKLYEDGDNSTVGDLRVCIDKPPPEFPNLEEDIVLVYSTESTEYNVEGNASETLDCAVFVVDVNTMDFTNPQTYYVRNGDIVGYSTFLFRFSPNYFTVENVTEAGVIRVSGEDVSDVSDCAPASSKVCYLSGNSDVAICSDVPVEDGGNIQICTGTVEPLTVEKKTDVASVQLHYDKNFISASVEGVDTSTLELLLFDAKEELVLDVGPGWCPMPVTIEDGSFHIGVVQIGAGNLVTASVREVVKDYAVKTSRLSHDTIEVTWAPWSKTTFEVSIQPLPYDNGFGLRGVTCNSTDPGACQSYFIKLEQDKWSEYLVNVTSTEGEYVTSTIVILDVSDVDEASASLTDIAIYTDDDFETTNAEICFQLKKENISSVLLLVIDVVGNTITNTINTARQSPLCSPGLGLNELEDDQLRMMVVFEDRNFTMCSTQVDVYIFKPEIFPLNNRTARASWRNLNSGQYYAKNYPGSAGSSEAVSIECPLTQLCNYYISETETGSEMFTISELANMVTQIVTVNKKLIDAKELSISAQFYKRFDDHLMVCFEPPTEEEPIRYELGVEYLGELVSSDQNAEIVKDYDGKTCAVSSATFSLGAYANMWAVVAAYNSTGIITQVGEAFNQDLYLSSDRYVLVVLEESVTPGKFSFKVSWKLVDRLVGLNEWHVYLKDENGKTIAQATQFVSVSSTYTFSDIDTGLYVACVSVSVKDPLRVSEDTCSYVIDLQSTDEVDVPMIEMDQLYTSTGELKIIWNVPVEAEETVSAVMIEWSTSAESKTRITEHVKRQNPYLIQQGVEPLSKTFKAAQNFSIVPAAQSSVNLPETVGKNICLYPIAGNNAGQPVCSNRLSVGKAPENVTSPKQLQFDGTFLSWVPPNEDENIVQYYVEFSQVGMTRHLKTSDTRVEVQTVVDPGEWTVSVHSVNGNGYISDPQEATTGIVVTGIYISYEQSGLRQITLTWQDIVDGAGDNQQQHWNYIITVAGSMTTKTVTCGQLLTVCSTVLNNIQANASLPVNVTVSRLDSTPYSNNTKSVYVIDVEEVTSLKAGNNQVTITWSCVPGADFYNVSLYDANQTLIHHDKQTLPCAYTFSNISLANGMDGIAVVQACTGQSRVRCGKRIETRLYTDNSEVDGSNTLVIILSTLAGCLVLLVLIAGLLFYRRNKKITASKNKDDKDKSPINSKDDHPDLTRSQSNEKGGIVNDAYQEQFSSNSGSDMPPPRSVPMVIPRSRTPPNLDFGEIPRNNRHSDYFETGPKQRPLDEPNKPNDRVFRPPRFLRKSPERPVARHATMPSTSQIFPWRQQSEAKLERQRSVSPVKRVGASSMTVPLKSTIPRLIVPPEPRRTSRKEEHELHDQNSKNKNRRLTRSNRPNVNSKKAHGTSPTRPQQRAVPHGSPNRQRRSFY